MAEEAPAKEDGVGLSFEVRWFDEDTVELLARCSSSTFAGAAECYAVPTVFEDIATALRGFPTSPSDERVIELGTFSAEFAGGGVRLQFRCVDGAGHVAARVRIRSPRQGGAEADADSAELTITFEPAALDAFVQALGSVPIEVGRVVELRGAG